MVYWSTPFYICNIKTATQTHNAMTEYAATIAEAEAACQLAGTTLQDWVIARNAADQTAHSAKFPGCTKMPTYYNTQKDYYRAALVVLDTLPAYTIKEVGTGARIATGGLTRAVTLLLQYQQDGEATNRQYILLDASGYIVPQSLWPAATCPSCETVATLRHTLNTEQRGKLTYYNCGQCGANSVARPGEELELSA